MPRLTEVVHLRDPIKHGDEDIAELTLTTPNLGELIKLDDAPGDMAKTLATLSICARLPPSVINQLMPWDMRKAGAALGRVMGESNDPTGADQ